MSNSNNTRPIGFHVQPQWLNNFNSSPGKTSSPNTTYTHFFIIAVVALSLVITLVLFLHLYLRYVRRRRLREFRSRRANLLALASFTGTPRAETPKGLDLGIISSIRSFQYHNRSANTSHEESNSSVREDCAVCLSFLEEGDVVRMLPACHHVFHVGCIDKWLVANASCPVCRADVNPTEQSVSVGQVSDVVTAESKDVEAEASVSTRLSLSFRRMLSRERSSRRIHGDGDGGVVGDLERGTEVINTS
ncbi:hypothetical protein LUZ60_000616 [Juncus effusus]|nr:hypothetical protein LUZ60_000616 [Juncus effusus]